MQIQTRRGILGSVGQRFTTWATNSTSQIPKFWLAWRRFPPGCGCPMFRTIILCCPGICIEPWLIIMPCWACWLGPTESRNKFNNRKDKRRRGLVVEPNGITVKNQRWWNRYSRYSTQKPTKMHKKVILYLLKLNTNLLTSQFTTKTRQATKPCCNDRPPSNSLD